MSYWALSLTLIFVLIPLLLSKTLNLGLGRDMKVATIRSIIQLLAVGYVLKFVFDSESLVYIFLMVALMIVAATHNAQKKGAAIQGRSRDLQRDYQARGHRRHGRAACAR